MYNFNRIGKILFALKRGKSKRFRMQPIDCLLRRIMLSSESKSEPYFKTGMAF